MAADIGAVFEGELVKVFSLLKETHLLAWHRFADTKSAGSVIAEQPSDYLLGLPPGSAGPLDGQRLFYLEAKASEKYHTLQKAAVKSAQRGAIARNRHLNQLAYLIFFWDTQLGVIQVWDGEAVMSDRLDKQYLLTTWENCGTVTRLATKVVVQHMIEHFQIPPAAATLANVR